MKLQAVAVGFGADAPPRVPMPSAVQLPAEQWRDRGVMSAKEARARRQFLSASIDELRARRDALDALISELERSGVERVIALPVDHLDRHWEALHPEVER